MTTFILEDENRGTEREFESKSEAEDTKQDLLGLGASESDLEITAKTGDPPDEATHTTDGSHNVQQGGKTDGGRVEPVEKVDEPIQEDYEDQLPEGGPSVDEDPLVWMPDEFTDDIQGTITINRKGFEVLAHHYDIQCDTESEVVPSDTDYEYAVVKATAVDAEGDTYGAYGEAKIDEEDMNAYELLRYADTRAYKRAISRATGVGMVAIEELKAGM